MEPIEKPSYLNDAIRFGAIFGLTASVLSTILTYQFLNSEPSGALFTPVSFAGILVCLVGAMTGLFTVRSYAKSSGLPMKSGQGAVIGVVAGSAFAIMTGIIGLIWSHLIDPTMTDRLMEHMIANFEAMPNIPAESKDQMIDAIATEFEKQKTLLGQLTAIGIQGVVSVLLNVITGIIGVAVFAKKEDIL
jgi:hypothetical protein